MNKATATLPAAAAGQGKHLGHGVHMINDSYVNWFLVEEGNDVTAIDAGLPASWQSLTRSMAELGHRLTDLKAIVLTHAHFDHVGFAERARRELEVPVWVHELDAPLARQPFHYQHERARLAYAWRPHLMKVMASFAAWGVLGTQGIESVRTFSDGQTLDVPGSPRVIFTPGHTFGHCALHLPERDILIAGDALVTVDPYTGRQGPRVVARAATADSQQALHSLDRLKDLDAEYLLTGHGPAWDSGVPYAVRLAQQNPVA